MYFGVNKLFHQIAIIRIKDDEYIPSFLAYNLNDNNVKKQLKRLIEGSNVPVIKINHLNNIVIEKRTKNKQIMYSKLFSFLDSRRRLLDRKRKLEDSLKNNILSKL